MIKFQDIMNETIEESIMSKKIGALILSLLLGKPDVSASPSASPSTDASRTNVISVEPNISQIEIQIKKNMLSTIKQVADVLANKTPNQVELNKFKNILKTDDIAFDDWMWRGKNLKKFDTDLYFKYLMSSYDLKPTDKEYVATQQILQKFKNDNLNILNAFKNKIPNSNLTIEQFQTLYEFMLYVAFIEKNQN
jgi:hypothetical protein